MWPRVDLVWTDVSEERIASIFRVQKSASEEPAWAGVFFVRILYHNFNKIWRRIHEVKDKIDWHRQLD
jgi:hypothetical protein